MLSNLNHLPNFRVQIKAFEITSQQRLRNFALCITLMRGPYMIYKKGKLRLGSANLELKNWLESWSREPREVTWSTYMGYNIYHPIWSSPLTRYRNMSKHPEKPPWLCFDFIQIQDNSPNPSTSFNRPFKRKPTRNKRHHFLWVLCLALHGEEHCFERDGWSWLPQSCLIIFKRIITF